MGPGSKTLPSSIDEYEPPEEDYEDEEDEDEGEEEEEDIEIEHANNNNNREHGSSNGGGVGDGSHINHHGLSGGGGDSSSGGGNGIIHFHNDTTSANAGIGSGLLPRYGYNKKYWNPFFFKLCHIDAFLSICIPSRTPTYIKFKLSFVHVHLRIFLFNHNLSFLSERSFISGIRVKTF